MKLKNLLIFIASYTKYECRLLYKYFLSAVYKLPKPLYTTYHYLIGKYEQFILSKPLKFAANGLLAAFFILRWGKKETC